jgi:2-keto-4-pentenoate hydratase/2-oxohepta-3-ene-1,7-dioic acid hydratase in catechol pathway
MAQNPPLWLKDGDQVSITIEKIGTLTNTVRKL